MTEADHPVETVPERVPPPRQSGGWSAVVVRQPSGPYRLRVSGYYVLFRPPDVGVQLQRSAAQPDGPEVLVLDRTLEQSDPDPSSVLAMGRLMPRTKREDVRYDEELDAAPTTVRILPDGVTVQVTPLDEP